MLEVKREQLCIQLHKKSVDEMTYIDQHENIDLIQKKLWNEKNIST